jgi:hypothetical protein
MLEVPKADLELPLQLCSALWLPIIVKDFGFSNLRTGLITSTPTGMCPTD